MFLAEVIGQVVSTKKDELMVGRKLLLLRPKLVDDKDPSKFKDGQNTIVTETKGKQKGPGTFCDSEELVFLLILLPFFTTSPLKIRKNDF